ncbi:MAG: thiamine pyrophosphate-binding protein [Bacteroidales bacterium]|nr:thiamine pyrophosphate-binding protein [Bacteroidales bacterium]
MPGVCHATFGPGATNLSTGVGGAMLDRSPLIALTSVKPVEIQDRTIQMNIDHQLLFEPITKATTVLTKNNIADVLSDAFDLALAETPGPVHIGLPSDLAYEEVKSMKNKNVLQWRAIPNYRLILSCWNY